MKIQGEDGSITKKRNFRTNNTVDTFVLDFHPPGNYEKFLLFKLPNLWYFDKAILET